MTLVLLCAGCASKGPLLKSDTLGYKSRAETRSDGGMLVSASALLEAVLRFVEEELTITSK